MCTIHYLDPQPAGAPAVLLLHGLGADGAMWSLQLEVLASAGFRPLAPDLPGFGDSSYDGRGWDFRRVAGQLRDWLEALRTGPVHLVGLSLGGVIAQQFALDYPHLVRKLVLVSTFSALRPTNASQWLYFLQRLFLVHVVGLEQQARLVARRVFPAPEQEALREMAAARIARADPRAYRAAMRALGMVNLHRRLHEIRAPTLVVTGEKDSTVSPEQQRTLAEGIAGAQQVLIAGGGHALAIDQAEAFNSVLLAFLQESKGVLSL